VIPTVFMTVTAPGSVKIQGC